MPHSKEINARHEVCHAILAKLFEEYFEIICISLLKNKCGIASGSANWAGVVNLKYKPKEPYSILEVDAYMITWWAGFIGQNIAYLGTEHFKKNKASILLKPNELNKEGIEVDYDNIKKVSPQQSFRKSLSELAQQVYCLSFLISFLTEDRIWVIVEAMSLELLSHSEQTMKAEEIEAFFLKSGYIEFLTTHRATIIDKLQHHINSLPLQI
jgi:hypothetical protein